MSYTQANQPLQIVTPLGADALLLEGVTGTEEVSKPFHFLLDLLAVQPITPEAVLEKAVSVKIRLFDGSFRTINGLVVRLTELDRVGPLVAYQAEMVPWLWLLSLSTDRRIFQDLSVPEIVEEVCRAAGFTDVQNKCIGTYPKREFCVQYGETNLDFVSRLLEEEGIFYFFDHVDDRAYFTLADAPSAVRPCPGARTVRAAATVGGVEEHDVVLAIRHDHTIHTGAVTLKDYDYLQPTLALLATQRGGTQVGELYDYPGRFDEPDRGDRIARVRLEEQEAHAFVARGKSNCRAFGAGFRFDLIEHARREANITYHLLQVSHAARVGGYRSGQESSFVYHNAFVAVPHELPYRPPRVTRRPRVYGTQTALVVGPAGEEIWVDKYGRVKLKFHWDRTDARDDTCSCWVRVSTLWAGRGWGAVHIPRVGQEVIVDFLEGDPDQPIVVGRVYNAEQTPPYALPANQTQSGMKSRSAAGGGQDNYNELRFEDKKGAEEIALHAERNLTMSVEADEAVSVGHDASLSVHNDRTIKVGGKHTETVTGDTTVTIESGKYAHDVAAGTATYHVAGKVTEAFDDALATTVANAITVESQGAQIALTAATEITLTVGAASLTLKSDGTIDLKGVAITIDGTTIDLKGQTETKMAVGSNEMKCTVSSAETTGATVKSAAIGVNEITGAAIKLN